MPVPRADELREKAAEILRAAVREMRDAERALSECSADRGALVLSAVEGLETLADTVSALLPQIPEALRAPLELSIRAAWERLQAAGIERDGVVGEPVDLARHRVIKSSGAGAGGPQVVAAVLAAGITLKGRRVRPAAVSAIREGADGARGH
jgi:molecular chaperone GrpE (heat shock protein)